MASVSDKERPSTEINSKYSDISRKDFGPGFVFGTGTSAYQHEGGALKGGRGLSVWDAFTLKTPERISDGSNGNVAVDMYTRYKEDIKMMKSMGFDAYRFSISWSRILPGGKISLGVNQEGIDFYNDVINTLIENDIIPYVTLFHWDLPYCLELEYGGFLDEKIVKDFVEYAELCFWEFGDRVKYWVTLNEPWTYSVFGYVACTFPPGRNGSASVADEIGANESESQSGSQKKGHNFIAYRGTPMKKDSKSNLLTPSSEYSESWSSSRRRLPGDVYTVARHLLLAHAAAVQSYRNKFKEHQKGEIGITLVCHWFKPSDETDDEDKKAAERALDFMLGWFLHPVLTGDYPQSMKDNVSPKNLESFSGKQTTMLQGSIDFLGLNYYTANYACNDPNPTCEDGYYKDQEVAYSPYDKNGVPIGPLADNSPWLYIYPLGIYELLEDINKKYGDKIPAIYITENGVSDENKSELTAKMACADKMRVNYHRDHLGNILDIKNNPEGKDTNIKGYFAWSLCDNFEWDKGYSFRFGLIYIDYMNNLKRYPKDSAVWFSKFLKK